MPALRFKTCRLLLGNVWKRKLSLIQRRILRRLRNQKRSIKRKISSRENLNSYIQSQTTRKLPLFHGNLPLTEIHRGRDQTSYIPFPLNPETRSDVIPVRIYFRETIPQARQPISHRKVCVNNGMVSITHFKVSHGDLISFQENDARTRGKEIRRSFYIEISVEKIIGKYLNSPVLMWRRNKRKWFKDFKTQSKCRQELKSWFFKMLRSYMQEKDFKRTGSEKVCLGCSFAEHNRMKRHFSNFKALFLFLLKRRNDKNLNLLTRTRSPILDILYNSSLSLYSNNYSNSTESLPLYSSNNSSNSTESLPLYSSNNSSNSTYLSASPHRLTRKINLRWLFKRKVKRIELPTHYSEVNYRTPKAVVSYGPNIGHIPHHIRLKDPNLLLRSGKGRGQNI